jgi:hypothetical protein
MWGFFCILQGYNPTNRISYSDSVGKKPDFRKRFPQNNSDSLILVGKRFFLYHQNPTKQQSENYSCRVLNFSPW